MIAEPIGAAAARLSVDAGGDGRLRALRAGGHTYFERDGDVVTLGDGLARISELCLKHGLLRRVRAGAASWVERFEWDAHGRPTHVDGVDVARDGSGRVVACGDWRYRYDGRGSLRAIAGPCGARQIANPPGDRPLAAAGGAGPPPSHQRDALGRTWCVLGPGGEIVTTYLWDGLACFGRIDGPPGAPLAAAFTLDPSNTPVRVIAADGTVARIPRDAFGEALLAHPGVPGLFGGVVHDGLVHTRARALDPRHGCWDRPDPWHGRPGDPRRAGGYEGPLPVEGPAGDEFTVCRGDPVGRADPTGEVSAGLIVSDLLWSHPNNLLSVFGLDLTLNFWGSLFSGRIERWGDFEGMSSSDRMGAFGLRRDGLTVYDDKAWTYQHLVFATHEQFDSLKNAKLFDPQGVWEPSLYGTVLLVRPAGGDPFVLRGSNHETDITPTPPATARRAARAPGWTRAGGRAVPSASGSLVPRFPSGALHFDAVQDGVRGSEATIAELAASGAPLAGTIVSTGEHRLTVAPAAAPATGRGVLRTSGPVTRVLTVQSVELLPDPATPNRAEAIVVLEPGRVLADAPTLHAVGSFGAAEPLTAIAGSPAMLALDTASSAAYAAGDVVRLSQPAGSPVGAAVVAALEARLRLDAAPPAGFSGAAAVREAAPGGAPAGGELSADRLTLTVAAGAPAPGPGAPILVTSGSASQPATVGVDGTTLDHALSDLAPGAVTWRRLAPGRLLGSTATPPSAASDTISYVPAVLRQPPAAGAPVWIEGAGAPVAVRAVRALVHEALVLDDLPGDTTAPYAVERATLGAGAMVLSLVAQGTLQLATDPGPLTAPALELVALDAAAVTARATPAPLDATLTAATLEISTPATLDFLPFAGQVAAVQGPSSTAPVVVDRVTMQVTFDRDIAATTTSRIVTLDAGLPVAGVSAGHPSLVVLPRADAAPRQRIEQPRLTAGEAIRVTHANPLPGPATITLLFRVATVDGAVVTVDGPAPLPAAGVACAVVRLTPAAPTIGRNDTTAGTPCAGIDAKRIAPAVATRWAVDVWQPGVLAAGTTVGVDDGTTTQPATVASVDRVAVRLSAPPAGVPDGAVDLAAANVSSITHATRFTQDGDRIVVDEALLPAGNQVLAIALVERGDARAGRLGSGGVLVPEELDLELDARASLVEHELRHTMQSAWWGPLLLGFFPLVAFQIGFELGTDADDPSKYSPIIPATLKKLGRTWMLEVSEPAGYAEDSKIQLFQRGESKLYWLTLDAPQADGRFAVELPSWAVEGDAHVRRWTGSGAETFMRTMINVGQILTHGGMLNLTAGTVWGGLFYLLGHAVNGLAQIGDRKTYGAQVEGDGLTLRLAAEVPALTGVAQVVVIVGDAQTVRAVASIEGPVLRLAAPVSARGAVQVAHFKGETADSYWDWKTYFPASVPDPQRPGQLKVEPVGDKRLELHAHDRVQVRSSLEGAEQNIRMNVKSVSGSGDAAIVELGEPPPGGGGPLPGDVQIARIAEDDPMGTWDEELLNRMGMGWMRWMFDPVGQIQLRAHAKPGGFGDTVLRILRYTMGTQSWSALVPGWFFLDNAFRCSDPQPGDPGGDTHYLSQMEQDASANSGNLYSSIARLHAAPTHVGDIGQYWVFDDRFTASLQGARGDAPGVWLLRTARLIPSRTPEVPGDPDLLNKGSQAQPAPAGADPGPGDEVAGVFWSTSPTDPREPPTTAADDPRTFPAADRGCVPTTPTMQRAVGAYVAFTRPPSPGARHRVTVQGLTGNNFKARNAHDEDKTTLLWDLDIADVAVTVGGRAVAEGDTIELLATERAGVSVTPGGARVYDVTVAAAPATATSGAARDMVLAGTAAVSAPIDVEIARLHGFDGDAPATPALRSRPFKAGSDVAAVHLPADIRVPVRRFSITITTALPARTAIDLLPASVLSSALTPGQMCFLVVPTEVVPGSPATGAATYPGVAAGLAAGMTAPGIRIEPLALPAQLSAQFPAGAAFRLTASADEPPEAACELTVQTTVGRDTHTAGLTTALQIQPHFTLDLPPGAVDNKVARGAAPAGGVVLRASIAPAAATVSPPDGITATIAGNDVTIAVGAGAAQTTRIVTVSDAADPSRKARRTIQIV